MFDGEGVSAWKGAEQCSAGGQTRSRAGDVVMVLRSKNKIDNLWSRYFVDL